MGVIFFLFFRLFYYFAMCFLQKRCFTGLLFSFFFYSLDILERKKRGGMIGGGWWEERTLRSACGVVRVRGYQFPLDRSRDKY